MSPGLFGSTLAPLLYFTGLSMTSATNAALLSNGEAVFMSVLAVAIFGETTKMRQVAAAILVLIGVGLVSSEPGSESFSGSFFGNLLVLTATLMWGVDNNLSRLAGQRLDPTILTKYKNAIGATGLLVFSLVSAGFRLPSLNQTPALVGIGVLGVGLSTAFLMHSLKRLGAVRAVMLFSTSSIFGLLFAHIFLGEQVVPVQIIGAGLMLGGLYLMNR
jgi:drug/metabolite transporter (DMT)-like permease